MFDIQPPKAAPWDDADSQIRPELAAGERLIWSGRPRRGVKLRPGDVFLIPFSLMWGGFAIFWEVSVIVAGAPFFFTLWGIPFVLMGLYLIFGRFLVDARLRAKTFYGLTNERVIIVSGLFQRSIKSLDLETLTGISLTERSDRSGTISLGPGHSLYAWFGQSSWPGVGQYSVPAFDSIEDAKAVYESIRDAQRDARKS